MESVVITVNDPPAAGVPVEDAPKPPLHGVLGADGAVKDLRVVSTTHPDFGRAALEAVAQWRYDPTRLNCSPVETTRSVTHL